MPTDIEQEPAEQETPLSHSPALPLSQAPPPPAHGDLLRDPRILAAWYKNQKIEPHPVLALPTAAQVAALLRQENGREQLKELLHRRQRKVGLMATDPFNHGYEPQMWRDADALLQGTYLTPLGRAIPRKRDVGVIGSNRAAKTRWAAKQTCKRLYKKPGAIAWLFTTDSTASERRDGQQDVVWQVMPAEWKRLNGTRSAKTYIAYKEKTGFAESSFIAPNGSSCYFYNYQMNRDKIEGGQIDWWWADEFLPADWLETLRGRTVDRKGQGALTQTPIHGYNATMGAYVSGGEVLAWDDAEPIPEFTEGPLWPRGAPGKIPYVVDSLDPRYAAIYFQARYNPFIPYAELLDLWKNSSKETKLIRWHGVTLRQSGSIFPRFGKHNVIKPERVPVQGTNYCLIDFAWARNWFIIWVRVEEYKGKKRVVVYRDWPDFQTYGEWALPSDKNEGERGPAQLTLGYGYNDYKELMLAKEGWARNPEGVWTPGAAVEQIFERYGDPRSGNATALAEEGGTSFITQMAESTPVLPAVDIVPWAGKDGTGEILVGTNLVNEWLRYDEQRPLPLGPDNEPILYISDACQNVITSINLYKGKSLKDAAKDPVDLLRAAAMMEVGYVEPGRMGSSGGGSY